MGNRKEWTSLAAAFTCGFLLAAATTVGRLPRSFADDEACGYEQVKEGRSDNDVPRQLIQNRGTKAHDPDGMQVFLNTSIVCNRANSIMVQDPITGDLVEIGYSQWKNTHPFCGGSFATTAPRRLVFWFDGAGHCWPPAAQQRPQISTGFHRVTLANFSLDGDFDVYLDDIWVYTWPTGWDIGWGLASSERWNTSTDPLKANFDGMQFQNGSGWHNWDYSRCYQDNSFTYGGYNDGPTTHVRVDVLADGHCPIP